MAADFQWQCHPQAEKLLLNYLQQCSAGNNAIALLQQNLTRSTSSRLFDWIDHFTLGFSEKTEQALEDAGFVSIDASPTFRVYHHPAAQLPMVVLKDQSLPSLELAIKVDSIGDFLMVFGAGGVIEGSPFSGYCQSCLSTENDISLSVIERRGILTMKPTYTDNDYLKKYIAAKEKWQCRPRNLENEEEALSLALAAAQEMIFLVGKDVSACIVLECEREYWQARNTAGQIQKNRQDRLGMGWANHDHHTFRSSRKHFTTLVRLFETLGFHCRERFYAGEEAGWGAQVMENPNSRLVLFLDVDLSPQELDVDFAHHHLPEKEKLGTIGLWCALHGDSILEAGMHHLEAQFNFEELKKDLSSLGVEMMDPFCNMPHLRQAFTVGEVWEVNPRRIQKLIRDGKISSELGEKFITSGAIGSHLENLQRREGFKGFSKTSVSGIIQKTDPRRHAVGSK